MQKNPLQSMECLQSLYFYWGHHALTGEPAGASLTQSAGKPGTDLCKDHVGRPRMKKARNGLGFILSILHFTVKWRAWLYSARETERTFPDESIAGACGTLRSCGVSF